MKPKNTLKVTALGVVLLSLSACSLNTADQTHIEEIETSAFFNTHELFYEADVDGEEVIMKNDQDLGAHSSIQIFPDGKYVLTDYAEELSDTYDLWNDRFITYNDSTYEYYRDFWRAEDHIVYLKCLEREYDNQLGNNRCTKEGLFSDENLIFENTIEKYLSPDDLLGQLLQEGSDDFIYVQYISFPYVYFAKDSDEYQRSFNLETQELTITEKPANTVGQINGSIVTYDELSDDLQEGEFLDYSIYNDSLYRTITNLKSNQMVLIKDGLKISEIEAQLNHLSINQTLRTEDESLCTLWSTEGSQFCLMQDHFVSQEVVNSSRNEDRTRSTYSVDGTLLHFPDNWTTDSGNEEVENLVSGVSFISSNNPMKNVLVHATRRLSTYSYKYSIYLLSFDEDGSIEGQELLIEDTTWFGLHGGIPKSQ